MGDINLNKKSKGFYFISSLFVLIVIAVAWSFYLNLKDNTVSDKQNISSKSNSKQVLTEEDSDNLINEYDDNESFIDFKKEEKNTSDITNLKRPVRTEKKLSSLRSRIRSNDNKNDTLAVSSNKIEKLLVVYPTNEEIVKEFSKDPVYFETMNDFRAHDGTDFKADEGSMIRSITDGKVLSIDEDPLRGNTIIIEHKIKDNEYIVSYSGLGSDSLVKKDESVKTGQELGCIKIVPSEIELGSHLHITIQDKKTNDFLDPAQVLSENRS
ncbi:MAG: M23 family peptidase [Candidatus Paraimprobicoccus trichonymphae]|uniref:M23 family peptidase n=1 Tax=Candidatus Paraimprobicoccus trichonymphae TaxID=3033793 RepID=A0AA48ICE1_9FIRM|nr:MAG: M23 family peptidase [Candidatus Paraimprobicoccus trichonymphae]